ncbi:MAG TPA: glycosyltransferase family 4 protein [Candidatus Kapabacteria bacterium]|nr:glycosyltransferase family 4 protein [Candidatus Kapabacteria bacterium]
MVEYIYKRAEAAGLIPTVLHYARFEEHPELNASIVNLTRAELNLWPQSESYQFHGMNAYAIGACLPEWEPNRIRANKLWHNALNNFSRFLLVTGSAHTGLQLASLGKSFISWVSSTVQTDRSERLRHTRSIHSFLERRSLPIIHKSELQVLNGSQRILAVSEDAKEHIATLISKPVEVWPYPINTDLFHSNEITDYQIPPRFLFVGRANDPRKRIDLFFQACDIFHDRWPKIEFIATIVSLETETTQISPSIKIEYRQSISDRELIELYRTSTALVLTSEQEGLGIAAMEAMACGLPVLSTRCGGPETFIVDNKTGFFVTDPYDLAKRMYELATNKTLRAKMGMASHERIENDFSEHVWNPKFEVLLRDIKLNVQ